ncbi:hypothetical protein DFP73DRAFT_592535 [Morchella snyderi]|nr:hypothetical protein DFP73DRAFT_592535 [Morchella snyderi]
MSHSFRYAPSYFSKVPFNQWNIKSFLAATLDHIRRSREAKQYNHKKATKDKRRATKWFKSHQSRLNQPARLDLPNKENTALVSVYNLATNENISQTIGNIDVCISHDLNTDDDTSYGNTDLDTDTYSDGDGGSGGDADGIDYDGNYNKDIVHSKERTLPPKTFRFVTTKRDLSTIITASTISAQHLAREDIVNLGNDLVMQLFEECEVLELKKLITQEPKPDEHFVQSLKLDNFREILETPLYRDATVAYEREMHADAEWVNQVFTHMVRLYERYRDLNHVINKETKEGWLDSNIWSILIDACVKSDTVIVTRVEIKATGTQSHNGKQPGAKLDGLLYTHDNPHLEFGAVEVSSDFKGTDTTKWLSDSNKLLTTLHTMAMHMSNLIDHDEDTMKTLGFVAFIHAVEEITPAQFYSSNGVCHSLSALQPSNSRIPYVWPLDFSSTASFDSVPYTSEVVPPYSSSLPAIPTTIANTAESAELLAPSPGNTDPLQHAGLVARIPENDDGADESEASALRRCKALLEIIKEKRPYASLENTGEALLEVLTAFQEKGIYKNRKNLLPTLRDEMKELMVFEEFMIFEEVGELLEEPKRSGKVAKRTHKIREFSFSYSIMGSDRFYPGVSVALYTESKTMSE